jgi:hypothetical protein
VARLDDDDGEADPPEDADVIRFVTLEQVEGSDDDEVYSGLFGGERGKIRVTTRAAEEVTAEWGRMMEKVGGLVKHAADKALHGPIPLDEIEVKLAFTAKGHVAFIAEAGVEAGITLTFRRPAGTAIPSPSPGPQPPPPSKPASAG